MSAVWLSITVAAAVLTLVGIAWGAHKWEMMKVDRVRRASLHRDRFRDLSFLVEILPEDSISRDLLYLLVKNMVLHLEKAVELDSANLDLSQRLQMSRELLFKVERGDRLPRSAPSGSIGEQLKDVQRALKILKEFILQQHKAGFLSKHTSMQNIKSLHTINLSATVDGLMGQAAHNVKEGNISLAQHYYQLGLTELTKSRSRHERHLEQLQFITDEMARLKDLKSKLDSGEISQDQIINGVFQPSGENETRPSATGQSGG
ncbi:MAG: hypothetical protein KDI36_13095 [Pseudomonadales bacterium]|nr:hypothetical protein [Pseudomonadales bacterium]